SDAVAPARYALPSYFGSATEEFCNARVAAARPLTRAERSCCARRVVSASVASRWAGELSEGCELTGGEAIGLALCACTLRRSPTLVDDPSLSPDGPGSQDKRGFP